MKRQRRPAQTGTHAASEEGLPSWVIAVSVVLGSLICIFGCIAAVIYKVIFSLKPCEKTSNIHSPLALIKVQLRSSFSTGYIFLGDSRYCRHGSTFQKYSPRRPSRLGQITRHKKSTRRGGTAAVPLPKAVLAHQPFLLQVVNRLRLTKPSKTH